MDIFGKNAPELIALADEIKNRKLSLKLQTSFRWAAMLEVCAHAIDVATQVGDDKSLKKAQKKAGELLEGRTRRPGIWVNQEHGLVATSAGTRGEATVFPEKGSNVAYIIFNQETMLPTGLSEDGRRNLRSKFKPCANFDLSCL